MARFRQPRPVSAVSLTLEPTTRDEAAYQRMRRKGGFAPGHSGRQRGTVPTAFRNGLPDRVDYVYNGTGEDVMAGSYGDPRLDGDDT